MGTDERGVKIDEIENLKVFSELTKQKRFEVFKVGGKILMYYSFLYFATAIVMLSVLVLPRDLGILIVAMVALLGGFAFFSIGDVYLGIVCFSLIYGLVNLGLCVGVFHRSIFVLRLSIILIMLNIILDIVILPFSFRFISIVLFGVRILVVWSLLHVNSVLQQIKHEKKLEEIMAKS